MAFSQGASRLSHLSSCLKSILGVTVESVKGSQVYQECIGTLGVYEMVALPLEFLLSVKLRPHPVEV